MSRSSWSLYLMTATALMAGALATPVAYAIQSSGSILLVPDDQTGIAPNQEVRIGVFFKNTSTRTPDPGPPPPPPPPPVPGAAADALLSGPISVDYACLNSCECPVARPDDLIFLGCDLTGGVATGCTAGAAGEVLINLPAGLVIPGGDTPVLLATLRLRNNVAPPTDLPTHFIRATTESCAVRACDDIIAQVNCTDCAAEGCSYIRGTSPSTPFSCKHGCENKIEFFPQSPAKQDLLKVNAVFHQPGYDPATQPFAVTVSTGGVTLFSQAEPFLPRAGTNAYRVTGPGNNTTAGLVEIEVTRRTGTGIGGIDCTNDWFKVIVQARGDFSAAASVNPTVRVEYTLGSMTYVSEEPWTSFSGAAGITKITFDTPRRSPC